jgi:hypothetical protein
MARRGRVIGVALGLIALFLFITSRNSGSHPRDLKSTKENREPLRPIIKEPPGTWDPVKDGFRDQQAGNPGSGSGRSGQEKPEAVMKQDTPAEDVSRKTPKKADPAKAADIAKGQPEPKKEVKKPGQGSGAVVPGTEEKEDQIVIDEYDPAEGLCTPESMLMTDLRVILTQAPMIVYILLISGLTSRYFPRLIVHIQKTPNVFFSSNIRCKNSLRQLLM